MGYTETRGKYRVGVCMGWAGVFFPSIYIVPVKKIYIENKKIYFRKKLSWVSDRRKIGLVFYFFISLHGNIFINAPIFTSGEGGDGGRV